MIYAGTDGADVAVQATDDGVRAQAILAGADSPTEYAYTFDGFTPTLNVDGSISLAPAGLGLNEGAGIGVPWAADANGTPVPTSYRVEGSTVIQVVEHNGGDYTYPVVADPYITFELGWYANWTKAETSYVAGNTATNVALAAAACGKIPDPLIKGACALAAGNAAYNIGQLFKDAVAQKACVQMHFAVTIYTYLGSSIVKCTR